MEHVFVETNFVVDMAAPAHLRVPAAVALVDRAQRGEIQLHIPAICLLEARPVLRGERFQPRSDVNPIREFLHGYGAASADRDSAFRALDAYESYMKKAVADAPGRVEALRTMAGVDLFVADDEILERSLDLMSRVERLTPFDLCVLASVLVRVERLRNQGERGPFSFCERDSDLQPWGRDGDRKRWLQSLYDTAHVWVYDDFTMTNPARPQSWPVVLPSS